MNNKNKISLSFDIEDLYSIRNRKLSQSQDFTNHHEGGFDCITEPTIRILNLLNDKNIKATFFIVADILDRYPLLSKKIRESCHEIGCHSMYHEIPKKNPEKYEIDIWERDLVFSKNKLENFFDKKIIGYRAPSAYLYDWMLDLLIKNEFLYDASVSNNNFYNKTNLINKNISGKPYLIKKIDNKKLIELPFNTWPILGFNLPFSGAFFYRLFGNNFANMSLRKSLSLSHTSFYMHPLDFSNDKFSTEVGIKKMIYWINKGDKTFTKFEKLTHIYRNSLCSCDQILRVLEKEKF